MDITDPEHSLSCGWLLQEVTTLYNLELKQRARDQLTGDKQRQRLKRKYIVALKTIEKREGIDYWLNQYER